MFVKIQKKKAKDGSVQRYASVVENKRMRGKTVQRTLINIGPVDEDQIPFLKAAWAKEKPRLIWD